jgi:hypothetical protein
MTFWSPVQLRDAFDAIVVSTPQPIIERPWGKRR